jgi:hypothetical protein
MSKKVTLLPFLKPIDLPMSQRVEIRQANEEYTEQIRQTRSKVEDRLEGGIGLLGEKGIKNHILECLKNAILGLRLSRTQVKIAVGREVLGEDMTWNEIQELFSRLLMTVCEKIIYEETKGGKIGSSPLEVLMMGCGDSVESAEVIEGAYKELGRLAKADYQSMMRLINMGLQIERAAKD